MHGVKSKNVLDRYPVPVTKRKLFVLEVWYYRYIVNVFRNFTEGWVEFLSKKVARRVADQLNNTQGKNQDTVSQCCAAGAEIKLPPVAGAEITNWRILSIYHRFEEI
jgi:hypothetical protein